MYDDSVGGWHLVVAFEWNGAAGEGNVLTNTIRAYSATEVTINDSLQVTESITCEGALSAGSVEAVALDTTRIAAIDSVGMALCTQDYSVAFAVQDNQDCTAHRDLRVIGDLIVDGHLRYSTITSPFHIAGKYNSATEAEECDIGRTRFTCVRDSIGQATVFFAEALPNDDYVITLSGLGHTYLSAMSATSFSIVSKDFNSELRDMSLMFTVTA
jgi:hypothetical protein